MEIITKFLNLLSKEIETDCMSLYTRTCLINANSVNWMNSVH